MADEPVQEPEVKERPKPVVEQVDGEPETNLPETPPVEDPSPASEALVPTESSVSSEEIVKEDPMTSDVEEVVVEDKKKGSFKTIFFTALVTAIVVGVLAGGIYVYFNGVGVGEEGKEKAKATSTPVATQTPDASPSAVPEAVDLSTYTVQILNGKGVSGAAGIAKTIAEKGGFEVVSTKNAANFNFENTVVQAKTEVDQGVVDTMEKTLAESYMVEIGDELSADSTYDIIVTVGSLEAE